MSHTGPRLPNSLKVTIAVIDKCDYTAKRIGNRLQVAVGRVIGCRKVVTVAVLDLSAAILLLIVTGTKMNCVPSVVRTTGAFGLEISNCV